MVCVGIDVAKDKHDCFILNSDGTVLADVFTIPSTMGGKDHVTIYFGKYDFAAVLVQLIRNLG